MSLVDEVGAKGVLVVFLYYHLRSNELFPEDFAPDFHLNSQPRTELCTQG